MKLKIDILKNKKHILRLVIILKEEIHINIYTFGYQQELEVKIHLLVLGNLLMMKLTKIILRK